MVQLVFNMQYLHMITFIVVAIEYLMEMCTEIEYKLLVKSNRVLPTYMTNLIEAFHIFY